MNETADTYSPIQLEIAEARLMMTFVNYHKYVGQKYMSHPLVMQFARNLSLDKAWEIVLLAPSTAFYTER